jgi:hypothetical protein
MVLKKNILAGKSSFFLYLPILFFLFTTISHSKSKLEGSFTEIKILDKISSKNTSLKLKNGQLLKFNDNPEITAYIQVRDLSNQNNDEVFVFNGWMFSSSPSITPFDHPIYDVWLVKCY